MTAGPDGTPPIDHYVSAAPFDPYSIERTAEGQEKYFLASQWKLMWWRFLRHRAAVISGIFLAILYGSILISEFIAPYRSGHARTSAIVLSPPQTVHLFHEGEFVGPFVYGYDFKLNTETLKREYTDDPTKVQKLRFFCRGDKYKFWGTDRRPVSISSARRRRDSCICWAPTKWARTCSRAWSMARASP